MKYRVTFEIEAEKYPEARKKVADLLGGLQAVVEAIPSEISDWSPWILQDYKETQKLITTMCNFRKKSGLSIRECKVLVEEATGQRH